MTLPDGVFAASLDADTEGEEGATYTWTADEVRDVLAAAGLADAWPLFAEAYDVTEAGNWEGRMILRRVRERRGPRGAPRAAARRGGRTSWSAPASRCSPCATAGPSRPATTRPSPAGTG